MTVGELLQKYWKMLLVVLGLGGGLLVTGAWTIPQHGVYVALLTDTTWDHIGMSVPCIIEVHPNTTRTIDSVWYGSPGNYIECARNATNWLQWTCDSFTADGLNHTCAVRVLQNEGGVNATEYLYNLSAQTYNITAVPGCLGVADCVVSGSQTVSASVSHRSITIPVGATLTLANGARIQAHTININGSLLLPAGGTMTFDGVDTWINSGTISGSGSTIVFNRLLSIVNSGTIQLSGAPGAAASPCYCLGEVPSSRCSSAYKSYTGGGPGGQGGAILITNGTPSFVNAGSIYLSGGSGGNSTNSAVCDACNSAWIIMFTPGNGGKAGYLALGNTYDFNNTGIITASAGNGGTALSPCPTNGIQGAGSNNIINASHSTTIANTMSASGSPVSTWSINRCSNGTGNNDAYVSPTPVIGNFTCYALPTTPAIFAPNTTSAYTTNLQNINASFNISYGLTAEVWFSQDNGTTWQRIDQLDSNFSRPAFNASNTSISTHLLSPSVQNIIRIRSYNASSDLYSGFISSSFFNVSQIPSNVSQVSVPAGSLTTNQIVFYCNYTNASGQTIEAATVQILLDGSLYDTAYNASSGLYWYSNTNPWIAGIHVWACIANKSDYQGAAGSNTNVSLTGFGIYYAKNQTSIRIFCPFPTYRSVIPYGQNAKTGILRIQNNNASALHNYTLYLNGTAPGLIYGRGDYYVPGDSRNGWTQIAALSGDTCLTNINSTNTSAQCWLTADCLSLIPGTYDFGIVVVEQ